MQSPCAIRQASRMPKVGASGASAAGTTSSALAVISVRRRPMRSEIGPHSQAPSAIEKISTETVEPGSRRTDAEARPELGQDRLRRVHRGEHARRSEQESGEGDALGAIGHGHTVGALGDIFQYQCAHVCKTIERLIELRHLRVVRRGGGGAALRACRSAPADGAAAALPAGAPARARARRRALPPQPAPRRADAGGQRARCPRHGARSRPPSARSPSCRGGRGRVVGTARARLRRLARPRRPAAARARAAPARARHRDRAARGQHVAADRPPAARAARRRARCGRRSRPTGIEIEVVGHEPLLAVLPDDHPLARRTLAAARGAARRAVRALPALDRPGPVRPDRRALPRGRLQPERRLRERRDGDDGRDGRGGRRRLRAAGVAHRRRAARASCRSAAATSRPRSPSPGLVAASRRSSARVRAAARASLGDR